MKITRITTSNFLGARAVDIELRKPVALIAGKNGAGKSSVQEAVRMALTGEPVRVSLKKDYGALLSEGADAGFADIMTDQSKYSVVLPGGKGVHCEAAALPYVLDAQRFARMDDNERRTFLFGLMGIKLDSASVTQRMLDKGLDSKKIEQIAPFLRGGFDAAQKEAAAKARDAKAAWKTVTGGETWGKDKAASWQPAAVACTAADAEKALIDIRRVIAADEADIGKLQQEIGAAKSEIARRQSAESRRMELHARAEQIGRIQARLDHDTAELADWEKKVEETRARAGGKPNPKAPGEYLLRGLAAVTDEFVAIANDKYFGQFDEALLNRASTHLAEYKRLHGWPHGSKPAEPDPEAITDLPKHEQARDLMKRAVANAQRDLEAAKAAKAEYDRILAEHGTALPDVAGLEKTLREITQRRDQYREEERQTMDNARIAAGRDKQIADAAKHHADVMALTDIAGALAPDGIPAELLTKALDPINEHLRLSAANAEWEPVQINADMTITYGVRDYALVSESEKWRADAMIAEAVSFLSGLRLLVLDRFDVLDLKGREDLMYWIDGMAADGDIDTTLIFGTLKALPAISFDNIGAHWIEGGAAGQMKEAA
ncbi:AAA family ATPase [Azonexus caeni]|uniref:AAA family ATPase n=1 Tax=Azonexus caeni TaxID=266126 RepID=UPI003A8400BC